jgi:hypothetical protein
MEGECTLSPADSVVSGAIVPIRRADRLFDILRIRRRNYVGRDGASDGPHAVAARAEIKRNGKDAVRMFKKIRSAA